MTADLLLAAAALHLGFQITVTVLVYPALAAEPADRWDRAHGNHSRRITGLVVVVYGLLVTALAVAGVAGPIDAGLVIATVGAVVSIGTTALSAAPLHQRLGGGRDQILITRLIRTDRLRAVAALVCFVGAAWRVG